VTKKKETHPLPLKHHKATNQAYVLVDGTRHYLGRIDAPETQGHYDAFLGDWLANGRRLAVESSDLTIIELCNLFRKHVDAYYVDAGGNRTAEAKHFATVIKPMRELYGATPACEFGPLKLKAVRERLMTADRSRCYVNKLVTKLKAMFKWAVTEELLPPESNVYRNLAAVPGLKRGRTTAREGEPVRPVPIEHVDAIRPFVSRQVAAIIDLQLLTAARQGELVIMRAIDLDMTGDVWIYEPREHKTAYRGHGRKIYLGPKAQEVVRPFLNRPVEAFLFSPGEAEAERREVQHKARKTPLSCGNKPGSNRVRKPCKAAGERYDSGNYAHAIAQACRRAWPVPAGLNPAEAKQWQEEHNWHPHQLRHTAATNLRKQFGLDVAAIMLGHTRCDVTQVYAEVNHDRAKGIAAKVG
jgi:integrase